MTDDERTPEDLRYRELFERSRQADADLPEKWDRQPIEPFPLPAEGAFKIIEELHAAEESE